MPTEAETRERADRQLRWERRQTRLTEKIKRMATIENVAELVRARDQLREAQETLRTARRLRDAHEIEWGEHNVLTSLVRVWGAQQMSGFNDANRS